MATNGKFHQDWRDRKIRLPAPGVLATEGEHGRPWYDLAGKSLRAYADQVGKEPEYVAGILAVLSPRVSVAWNARYADLYLRHGTTHPRILTSVRAALAHFEATGQIRGPKTSAFKAALLGDPEAVVVDIWAARALQIADDGRLEGKRYVEAVDKIRRVARRLRWPPAETQAAIWTGVRARFGFHHANLDLLALTAQADLFDQPTCGV